MLNRVFTKREAAGLVFLAFVLLALMYYLVIWSPSSEAIEQADATVALLQDEISVETVKVNKIQVMKDQIEKAAKQKDFESAVATYDNLQNVMVQLDSILSISTDYNLSFSQLEEENGLYFRPIDVNFTCPNYTVAEDIINRIYRCQYSCTIESVRVEDSQTVSMFGDNIGSPVKVAMKVVFVEKPAK